MTSGPLMEDTIDAPLSPEYPEALGADGSFSEDTALVFYSFMKVIREESGDMTAARVNECIFYHCIVCGMLKTAPNS